MSTTLKDLKDASAMMAFGMTKDEAHEKGICIHCKKPPVHKTELDKREYAISGICGSCFDVITKDPDDE